MYRTACIVALAALACGGAWAQDCSGFNPACPHLVVAASVASPTCPAGSAWDEETSACYLPCSSHNAANVTYAPHKEDPATCVPACSGGAAARPGADGYSTQCVLCPSGSSIVAGKKGNWVCRRGGQTTLPRKTSTLVYKARAEVAGGCAPGAAYVNGVCAACTSCDTYLNGTPEGETPRHYLFWQAEGATFCVPDACCYKESWMIEGGGCADGDCDVAPEDQYAS